MPAEGRTRIAPERRLGLDVARAGGRLKLTTSDLVEWFGPGREEAVNENATRCLKRVGVTVDPPLAGKDADTSVTLTLSRGLDDDLAAREDPPESEPEWVSPEAALRSEIGRLGHPLQLRIDELYERFSLPRRPGFEKAMPYWLRSAGVAIDRSTIGLKPGALVTLSLCHPSATPTVRTPGIDATPWRAPRARRGIDWRLLPRRVFALPRLRFSPRARRGLGYAVLVASVLLLVEGAVTLLWQEPFTYFENQQAQDDLRSELRDVESKPLALTATQRQILAETRDIDRRRIRQFGFAAAALDKKTSHGHSLGRLKIDKLGVKLVFIQGTDNVTLQKGPGHYDDTALPGGRGTVGIAGHRTTYGAPFRHIDDLKRGDKIHLDMAYGRFTYIVEKHAIVPPNAVRVLRTRGYNRLVLTACHPLWSDEKRIVVTARLERKVPHAKKS